ncbi:Flp family type IVb pilin [Aliirhizobium cellulosilyticum]|jgi:pilus assembly protein Flp/PilA|uniref:Pilus assembly protein Flp/PilA n=1 Tax=Aliirhizobium cellulosilyticum TaxID=393664 RepID=A0A7W4SU21_9HYPH|nr:Flp family type IVb pilin [Rhizobium cellulosilyticum]MBB4350816.1 pilus assembly protein Flp/PilA [Rhizobium cellulosilyticum]MBB4414196.1 pilus assembly protein Flp/PilA [Rhizobium cellulosilyticum]MBB4448812.1 pilus assembly protein Flp/PilA [Rhizobium cellulosilyticum]
MRLFRSFIRDISGATAVEYGLLAAVLGITLAAALGNYYEAMGNMFNTITNTYTNASK